MGQDISGLQEKELGNLKDTTSFSKEDIKFLWEKFKDLDKDGNMGLSLEELKKIPEIGVNPLLERAMHMIGVDEKNEILFVNLVNCFNVFNEMDTRKKLELYDIDNDGKISNGELYKVLAKMVGKNLTPEQLQQIVDKTILEADSTGTGSVNFEDFVKILNVDLEKAMAFNMKVEAEKGQKN